MTTQSLRELMLVLTPIDGGLVKWITGRFCFGLTKPIPQLVYVVELLIIIIFLIDVLTHSELEGLVQECVDAVLRSSVLTHLNRVVDESVVTEYVLHGGATCELAIWVTTTPNWVHGESSLGML